MNKYNKIKRRRRTTLIIPDLPSIVDGFLKSDFSDYRRWSVRRLKILSGRVPDDRLPNFTPNNL